MSGPQRPRCARLVLSAFGLGFVPVAPGTAASAASAVAYVGLALAVSEPWLTGACAAAAVVAGAATVVLAPAVIESEGKSDPQIIVTDEVAGMLVTFLWMPECPLALKVVAGFACFRLFDILKPTGVKDLERLPRGWGVLADDVAAGVLANVCVRAVVLVWGALAG